MRDLLLFVEAILFTVLVPGSVTVWIPWLLFGPAVVRLPETPGAIEIAAIIPLLLGIIIYLWCVFDFAKRGRGIPAPIDHPKHLVVTGLYRYVRNPMYIGVLLVLIGEAVMFRSGLFLLYASALFLAFNIAVIVYEEPVLRRKFGTSYEQYKSETGRWIPRYLKRRRFSDKSSGGDPNE